MDRITVGVDVSDAANGALSWAVSLASESGAEVVAANCFRHPYAEINQLARERLVEERKATLSELRTAPGAHHETKVKSVVVEGDPRNALLAMAEADAADLLVLGRTGAGSGPGFLHLGSVVEHIAHHTSIPLAVIPPGWTGVPKRIVVGVDGSAGSHDALSWVAEIATSLGSTIVVVQVAEPQVEWTAASGPESWRRNVERHIEQWTAPLEKLGVPVLPIAKQDLHPVDGLLGVAAAQHGDLVVVGTRGVGGFPGLGVGGVALKVLHHVGVPMVLVPERRPATPDPTSLLFADEAISL